MEPGKPGQAGIVGGQVLTGMGVPHRDQINSHAVCGHGGTQRGKALGYGIHAHNDSFLFSMAGPPEKPPAAGNFSVSYCIIPGKRLQCRGVRTLSVIAARCHLPRKGRCYSTYRKMAKSSPCVERLSPAGGRWRSQKGERLANAVSLRGLASSQQNRQVLTEGVRSPSKCRQFAKNVTIFS